MKILQSSMWKSVIKNYLKSKTMIFALVLTTLGIVEMNFHVFMNLLGDSYGIAFVVIALINGWLRVVTTTSLEDKQ